VQRAEAVVAELGTTLARIAPRSLAPSPDSPFAMCWGTNFYLMGLAGVKTERVGSAYWAKIEPFPGVFMPDQPDATQYYSLQGYRRYATRWGVALPEQFTYGENWLGGSFPECRIHSYDSFVGYMLRVVDMYGDQGVPYYQFWNEPNYFWHVPGPFSREHFGLVSKLAWNVVKARDKEAASIPDGDAGGLGMMQEMAGWGANAYNDAVEVHYPGTKPVSFDNMPVSDLPESKVEMLKDLVAIRDHGFPGKPIWNTEEGWWGPRTRLPK